MSLFPVSFNAIPFETGIKLLLEFRREKNFELEEAATEIIKDFRKNVQVPNSISEVNPKFVLIPPGQIFVTRVKQAMERAQTKMDFLASERVFPLAYSAHIQDWQKLIEKGIKIR